MPYLIFTRNGPSEPMEIGSAAIVLGRAPDCDVQVNDNQLSRRHCRFVPKGSSVLIEDLKSANGTRLNGVKLEKPSPLRPGDRVQLGGAEVVFSLDGKLPDGVPAAGEAPDSIHLALKAVPDGVTLPQYIPLTADAMKVGRKAGNDVVLRATVVSGEHCELIKTGNAYRIRDLGSTNGVKINGTKVPDAILRNGDEIAFDTVSYVYVDPSGPAPSAVEVSGAHLVVEKGPITPAKIALSAAVTFGRKPGNTFVIKGDSEISSNHAKIEQGDGGRWVVLDTGSTNGTKLDGKPLTANAAQPLLNGSLIRMGGVVLRFVDPNAPAAPAAPKARSKSVREKPTPAQAGADTQINEGIGLADELDLDMDKAETQRVAATSVGPAIADASTPDDLQSALEEEMGAFLASGSKRRRSPVWRFAEVGVVVAALGAVVFAIVTSQQVKPAVVDDDRPAPAPSDSLVKTNWSFETSDGLDDGGGGRPPDGWDFIMGPQDSAYLVGDGKTGKNSLEIQRGANDYSTTDVVYTDAIPLDGKSVEAHTWVRRTGEVGGSGAGLHILYYGGANGAEFISAVLSPCAAGTEEWQEVAFTALPPAGATHARVACCVVGEKARFAFDDVTAKLVASEGTPMKKAQLVSGRLRWDVNEAGLFDLVRLEEDRTDALIRDADVTFTSRNRQWSNGLLSDMATTRTIEDVPGQNPAIRLVVSMIEPFQKGPGGKLPVCTAVVTLSFVNGQPTVLVQASGEVSLAGVGVSGRVRGVNRLRPFARFNSQGLTFHRYSDGIGIGRGKELATRLVMPRGEEFLQFETADAPFVVRVEQDRQDGLLDVFTASGSSLQLALALNPDAAERTSISNEIQAARSEGRWGDALDAILRLMQLSIFSRGAIVEAANSVSTVVARLRYRITELEDALNNLRNGFTRDGFLRMQQQYNSLLEAIGKKPITGTHGPFLRTYGSVTGTPDRELDYSRFFRDIQSGLNTLDSVETQFDTWIQQNRANVDAATLSRIEDDARKLLVRALDFDRPESRRRTMAIETYREVLRQFPLGRPATYARRQLVLLANELNREADAQQRTYPEMAAGNRALAKAIAKSALSNVWSDGDVDRKIWDTQTDTWSSDRTAEFVSNSFRVRNAPPATTPAWQMSWPTGADKWWDWTEDGWRRIEADARRTAKGLVGE